MGFEHFRGRQNGLVPFGQSRWVRHRSGADCQVAADPPDIQEAEQKVTLLSLELSRCRHSGFKRWRCFKEK